MATRNEPKSLCDLNATSCPRCGGSRQEYRFCRQYARRMCLKPGCRWEVAVDTTPDVKASMLTVEHAHAWWAKVYG